MRTQEKVRTGRIRHVDHRFIQPFSLMSVESIKCIRKSKEDNTDLQLRCRRWNQT